MRTQTRHARQDLRTSLTAIMLILWLGAALAGCDGPPLGGFTHLVPTRTPTATPTVGIQPTISPTPNMLPAFSGWRAAYLHSDGHLHAISLSDHSELVGMVMPGLAGDPTSTITSAGVSPDGRAIAYDVVYGGVGTLTVLDLARHHVLSLPMRSYVGLKWSPDGSRLAVDQSVDQQSILNLISLLDLSTGKLVDITPHDLARPVIEGWRDTDHLVLETTDLNYTQVTLWLEDVRTQAVHQLLQIPVTSQNANFTITIAPNGAACVLYTWQFQSNPFTPLVETVDLTTGALHPLLNITKMTGANFTNLTATWRADGTQLAMARPGAPDNSQINSIWIMDLASDTAILGDEGNNPVGWAPDGSAIILSGLDITTFGYPPHGLAVLRLPLQVPRLTELTDSAVVFPFLGFVRGG